MPRTDKTARLTVSIATRNRLESLTRCVSSIKLIADIVDEIIVVDDASDETMEGPLRRNLGSDFPSKITVLTQGENIGTSSARNMIVKSAETDFVLNLDDDAFVLDAKAVRDAIDVMVRDERVAAVAMTQASADGKAWPVFMQPAPVNYPCQVPTFIGYGCVLRRAPFLSLGGFRTAYSYMGEEQELCLRLLDEGYKVVYLPESKVGHIADPNNRDSARFLRLTIRNNCFTSLYNDPLIVMMARVPFRLGSYFRMKRGLEIDDPGGFVWIMKQLVSKLSTVWRDRHPVKWATISRWKQLRAEWPSYEAP